MQEKHTANLQKAHDASHQVFIHKDRAANMRIAGDGIREWSHPEISKKRKDLHRSASKKEFRFKARKAMLAGVLGGVAYLSLFGMPKIMDYHPVAEETPSETKIVKAYESHKKDVFDVFKGHVVVQPGATIRENPFVLGGESDLDPSNQINPSDVIDGYKSDQELTIKNPAVLTDKMNPANGVWYAFMVKEGEEYKTYWTNHENIVDRSEHGQLVEYDGHEKVGVVSQ